MTISRFLLSFAGLAAIACGGATPGPETTPSPSSGGAAAPIASAAWPVRTREHVDLWLHAYALISNDTMKVPYFSRGYRARIDATRKQKGVVSLVDTYREKLLARAAVQPSILTNGQFIPLYFPSWDQMKQAIDVFVRSGGNPGASNDPAMQLYLAVLGGTFQSAADREWLRTFTEAADDESRRFYHDYWTTETRSRAAVVARVDSQWQRVWRPGLQRLLNNTQQQNGELYLSLPLGGEGRTVQFGKANNAVAVAMPATIAESEIVLYVVAHEITGSIASTAITDNTTPADLRAGTTSQYEQAAAVRAGAFLLERTHPTAVRGYMRYYLTQAGMPVPNDPQAAFNSVFGLPESIKAAIAKQLDVILGGI